MIVLMNRYNFKEFLPYYSSLDFTFTPTDSSVDNPYFFISNPSTDDFILELYTSGTLTFNMSFYADWFAVGGGGGGGAKVGGGGGGGYTTTILNSPIQKNVPYTITVGAGGTGSAANSTARAASGGASSVYDNEIMIINANGGQGGDSGNGAVNGRRGGGAGGSGGGGGSYGDNQTGGHGGTDGSNGTKGTYSSGNSAKAGSGGAGQGTTTRAFGESEGKLYSGGGGASGSGLAGDETAADANITSMTQRIALPNRGGGGGGGYSAGPGSDGGSGIVIVRFAKMFANYLNG